MAYSDYNRKKQIVKGLVLLSLASEGDYFSMTLLFCFLTPSYKAWIRRSSAKPVCWGQHRKDCVSITIFKVHISNEQEKITIIVHMEIPRQAYQAGHYENWIWNILPELS